MIGDNNTILDLGTGETLTTQRIFSTDNINLGQSMYPNREMGMGSAHEFLNFIVKTAVAGATAGSTVELQAVTTFFPIMTAAVVTVATTAAVVATDILTSNAAHGMATGTAFKITDLGGAVIAGVAINQTVWAIRLSATTFSIAITLALALAGTAADITTTNAGSALLITTADVGITADIGVGSAFANVTTDLFTLTNHGLQTGQPIRLFWAGTLAITGITTGVYCYAIRIDADTFKVATTFANCFTTTGTTPYTAADITTTTSAITTLVADPVIVGTSGAIQKDLLTLGSIVPVRLSPGFDVGITVGGASVGAVSRPVGRNLFAAYNPSATMTAGKFYVTAGADSLGGRKYHETSIRVI